VSGQIDGAAAIPTYPLARRLGGPHYPLGRCGDEKNILPLPGIEPQFLGRPVHSLVAIPTEISQPLYVMRQYMLKCGSGLFVL
jgi:hypothetical protein